MEKLKGTEVTTGPRVAGVLTGDWYCDCGRKDRSVEPPCQGSQAGGSWEVPAPGLGGPAGIAPSTGTLPGPVPEPPARHLHQRGMATPRAARERALLPCFWDNPNFPNGVKKPFQACLAEAEQRGDPTWVIRNPLG